MDIGEIQKWIEDRRQMYEAALNLIRQELLKFWHYSPQGRRMIYRVASRGDYQQGVELKTVQSIKGKLEQKTAGGKVLDAILKKGEIGQGELIGLVRRNDLDEFWLEEMVGRKKILVSEGAGGKVFTTTREARDKLVNYSIYNIEDIIGCKIVAIYPQYMEVLARAITEEIGRRVYGVESEEEVTQESGYRGHHFVVRPTLAGYNPYMCEIQLVTMLDETWAFKTHDLTYKGRVKPEYKKEARLLSDALRVIDDQSEFLMQKIADKVLAEDQKRDICKRNLFKKLLEESAKESPDIEPIARIIQTEMDRLAHGQVDHIFSQLAGYSKAHGNDRHFCRAVGLLAALRRDNDLDQMALHSADRLIAESAEKDKAKAMIFKGLLLYCFDRTEDGIVLSRDAVRVADGSGNVLDRFLARQNLGYWIADADRKQFEEEGKVALEEASRLLEQDQSLKAKHLKTLQDTQGYFEITFGKTLEELEAGWQKCKEASEGHPLGTELPKSYLRIHQVRVLSKMLDMALKHE